MEINPYAPPHGVIAAKPAEPVPQGRPVGVWVATIWAGLFAGVLPLLLELFVLFLAPANVREVMGVGSLVFSAVLAIAIIASAVGAFLGHSASRYILVMLVVIHYLLVAYNNFTMLSAEGDVPGGATRLIARIVRSIVTSGIIAAYLLLNRRARGFFNRRNSGVSHGHRI